MVLYSFLTENRTACIVCIPRMQYPAIQTYCGVYFNKLNHITGFTVDHNNNFSVSLQTNTGGTQRIECFTNF